ncbi:hypothetical protein [Haloactinomyces albus]|uniref:Phage integrase family protein n=1 Tax=Haloactinomyces albus TaxID=1352928 RepID=A0AAE4CNN4_9ACTN|nr:hypothetical protein [Haloactinomyces albus]MDR7304630.1 hypothetical protein [Haloactinomyces albus]
MWRTATARLLPRLLDGRKSEPVFLTDRRARVELPPVDVDPGSRRARLSYRRATETFEQATTNLTGGPHTLHQLRHSTLTHAAEDRTNTSTLLAFSGHNIGGLTGPMLEGLPGSADPLAACPRPCRSSPVTCGGAPVVGQSPLGSGLVRWAGGCAGGTVSSTVVTKAVASAGAPLEFPWRIGNVITEADVGSETGRLL